MPFSGVDIARYPGDQSMRWLRSNTNLVWVGFYLPVAGPGMADKKTWQGKFGTLKGMGWGVAPIYVGKQRDSEKLKQKAGSERLEGYTDGLEAASMAQAEGMPARTVLYFDYEAGDQMGKSYLEYQVGWVQAVLDQGFRPGIYCSFLVGAQYVSAMAQATNRPGVIASVWVHDIRRFGFGKPFSPPFPTDSPAGSGFSGAAVWQFAHGATIKVDSQPLNPVDMNSSLQADPGNP